MPLPLSLCRAALLRVTLALSMIGGAVVLAAAEPEKAEATAAKADAAKASGARFDPVERDLEGWNVFVEPALVEGEFAEDGARALKMLANHLQRIKIVVPARPLARLQQIGIWLEHEHPQYRSLRYHPSRQWLIEHGEDERLARKVHVPQAALLLSREQMLKHPAMVLHELAHGYHDQVLGFDNPDVIAAFERAKAAHLYDEVLAHTGKTIRHYALSNHKEYFAEGTEAWFYRNDFYPFVRAELQQHDPPLADVLKQVWDDQ
jgi:dipeptidyl-peptidase-4